ncbi:MAG: hypothetical protein DI563_15325 [Variovorax paradoxus]|uniref:DUF4124 domain-containing protein n=1 Tax=Variovorax paradoxus TaxID=34073 RepID=A0A2W5Q7C6_VARPD|nr:MAG: hypothetical protein DI563_15325 [Variovorax paradoxus]
MRTIACCLFLLAALPAAHADVLRCTDAAGKVSYTDQPACPAGSKPTGNVPVPEAAPPGSVPSDRAVRDQLDSVNRARQLQQDTVDAATRPAQPPAGAAIIDGRGGNARDAVPDPRYSDRGEPGIVADTWYPYGSGYYGRPAPPPRDMRPTGNHTNRKGQIDRYQNGDGRTCRQINSTQVCR